MSTALTAAQLIDMLRMVHPETPVGLNCEIGSETHPVTGTALHGKPRPAFVVYVDVSDDLSTSEIDDDESED
jgi:hypothetical protein